MSRLKKWRHDMQHKKLYPGSFLFVNVNLPDNRTPLQILEEYNQRGIFHIGHDNPSEFTITRL